MLETLLTVGYHVSDAVLIPLWMRKAAIEAINNAPELLEPRVGGTSCSGFGGLGAASAFHNLPAREIRAIVHKYILGHSLGGRFFQTIQSLMDRMGAQLPWKRRGGESWHRDVTPGLEANGECLCLGGFANLGEANQYFACAPGNIGKRIGTGFDKIPKSETAALNSQEASVCVRPGEVIFFNQLLAHKVRPGAPKVPAFRQYISVLLSKSRQPQSPIAHAEAMGWYNIKDATTDQKSVNIPSGQAGHFLCPKLYNVNHPKLAEQQANLLRPECRTLTAKGLTTCKQFAPSLRELNALYPPYKPDDTAILTPKHIGPIIIDDTAILTPKHIGPIVIIVD